MSRRTTSRPNFVVILSDQHHAGFLGCAGHPLVRTPHMDRLAARGIRFRNAYTSSPICVPARMGFMTMRSPSDIRCWSNRCILDSSIPTFAGQLAAAGYETILAGKMHFQGADQWHGFTTRPLADPVGEHLFDSDLYRSREGESWTGSSGYAVRFSGPGRQGFQYYDKAATEETCALLDTRPPDASPFCLVTGLICPHNPYVCEQELFDEYYSQLRSPDLPQPADWEQWHPGLGKLFTRMRGMSDLTPEDHRRALAAYLGLITETDRNLGRIIETLERSPFADNTIVIYTSDHGDMAAERGFWFKSLFLDASSRVPLIVSCPERFRTGAEVQQVVSLLDVGATLLDFGCAEPVPNQEGLSLRGPLEGKDDAENWPDRAWAEEMGMGGRGPSCMFRTGPWKYIHHHADGSEELFQMDEDPCETTNRCGDPDCAAVLLTLRRERERRRWDGRLIGEQLKENHSANGKWKAAGGTPEMPGLRPVIAPPEYRCFASAEERSIAP